MKTLDLLNAITEHLTKRPEDHSLISGAVCLGMSLAFKERDAQLTASNRGMMSALILADFATSARAKSDLMPTLLSNIATAINPANASEIEKRFLALNDCNPGKTSADD